MTIEQYKELIKSRQSEKRFYHSLCVADEAKRLAAKYGADPDKMYLAGLLHDITKNTDLQDQLKLIENGGIMLTDVEKKATGTLHSISGYVYLRDVLKMTDTDVLSAVRYHTTGKENMSLSEKIVFIADLTSAERDYPDVEKVRTMVDKNLDEAILYVLKFTLNKLVNKGLPIHHDTLKAYNFMIVNN